MARGTEPASGAQPRGGSRDARNRVPHVAAEAAVQTSWCRVSPGARAPGGLWVSALRGSGFFTEHTRSAGATSDPAGAVTRKFDPKGVSSRLQTQQTERATFISIDTRSEPRLGGRRTQRRRAGVRLEGRIGSVRVIDDPCGGHGVVVPVPRPHRETQKGGGKARGQENRRRKPRPERSGRQETGRAEGHLEALRRPATPKPGCRTGQSQGQRCGPAAVGWGGLGWWRKRAEGGGHTLSVANSVFKTIMLLN